MDKRELIQKAIDALPASYAPYSHFHVAAALLCGDGSVYIGNNIENASYSATVCAERCAFFKAVSDGKKEISGDRHMRRPKWRDNGLLPALRRLPAGNAGVLCSKGVSDLSGKEQGGLCGVYPGTAAAHELWTGEAFLISAAVSEEARPISGDAAGGSPSRAPQTAQPPTVLKRQRRKETVL